MGSLWIAPFPTMASIHEISIQFHFSHYQTASFHSVAAPFSNVKGLLRHFQISSSAPWKPSHVVLLKYLMTLIYLPKRRAEAGRPVLEIPKESSQIGSDFNSKHRQQRNLNMTTLNLMWSGIRAKFERKTKRTIEEIKRRCQNPRSWTTEKLFDNKRKASGRNCCVYMRINTIQQLPRDWCE